MPDATRAWTDIDGYDFAIAFNLFRLAAISHGIKDRTIRGTAASVHARERANALPTLIALACDAMDACGKRTLT